MFEIEPKRRSLVAILSILIFTTRSCPVFAAAPSSTEPPTISGAQVVREIDWNSLGPGSPIPEQMPATDSDDPVEAGFARQWVERVEAPGDFPWKKLALEVVSKHRTPNDLWASGMVKELRDIIRTKVPTAKNARVFCNSVGCLCYVERDEPFLRQSIVYLALLGDRGRKWGLERTDLDAIENIRRPDIPWELTIVRHRSSGSRMQSDVSQ
jgi:hypothetical protein